MLDKKIYVIQIQRKKQEQFSGKNMPVTGKTFPVKLTYFPFHDLNPRQMRKIAVTGTKHY